MAKSKISVYSCASAFAVLLVASAYAEITGSGFRNTDCTGLIHVNLWMDFDGDGFQDRSEPSFPKADVYVSIAGTPEKGIDKFTTDLEGRTVIDALCEGTFNLEVDEATIPESATLEAVYEYGAVVVDADVTTEINIDLTEGSGTMALEMRHLDFAYAPQTRGLRLR